MHSIGRLEHGAEDVLDPRSWEINFDDGVDQVLVIDTMRWAWVRTKPEGEDPHRYLWMLARSQSALGKDNELPDDLNLDVDSDWKESIYYWCEAFHGPARITLLMPCIDNHLFADVAGHLPSVNCALGHFHGPKHSHFPIESTSSQRTFETNVLILPAYLARGYSVVLSSTNDVGATSSLGSFTSADRHKVLLLERDMKVDFHVEKIDGEHADGDLASVMVVGHLCIENQRKSNEHDEDAGDEIDARPDDEDEHAEDDDRDDMTLQQEVQSSIMNVMQMYMMDQQRKTAEAATATQVKEGQSGRVDEVDDTAS